MKSLRLIALTLCLAVVDFKAFAFDNGDFQIWHTEDQDITINKRSKVALEEEFRFGDDASEFFYHHYDAGLGYEVNENLALSVNYRQIWELKGKVFQPEYRPHVNAVLKWDLWGFPCEDRNRFEYRIFDYQEDSVRYRNKFTVKWPWKFTKMEFRPYVSDELFADLSGAIVRKNRFYTGLGFSLLKNLKGEIFYLLQSDKKSGKWTVANILGTKIKIIF